MVKKLFTFVLAVTVILLIGCDNSGNVDDPDKTAFVKYYGMDGDQSAVDMLMLADGSVLLLGNTRTATTKRIYLVKVDQLGNLIWEKKLGGTADVSVDIEPITEDRFAILSRVEDVVSDHDFKLIVVNDRGDKIDSVVNGYVGKNDNPHAVTPLGDGGFIITGATQYDPTGFNPTDPEMYANIFHFRCDERLDFNYPVWEKLYGSPQTFDESVKVFEEGSNGFYVFGYSNQPHSQNLSGKNNLLYYSIATNGNAADQPGYTGDFQENTRLDYVTRAPIEFGGGFFQVGTRTNGNGTISLQISKLRPNLTFTSEDEQLNEEISILSRPMQAVSATGSVTSAPQGYLLLADETRSLGTKNIALTKIDQQGRVIWSVSLGSEEENDEAAAVTELADGRILVLGTVGVGDNQSKMALFKLNSTGRLHD
jgi:hypothetical protein